MPQAKRAPRKKAYHHGDLRRALLEASLALIEKHGIEALSLREVAREALVSSAAPYHHFANKAELLGAVAGNGFRGLAEAMQAALAGLDTCDPIARLAALGEAYVAFARARPTEFRLMFRPSLVSAADLPSDCDPSQAFSLLLEAVEGTTRLLPKGFLEPAALTTTAWAVVHGAAELVLDGPLAADDSKLGMPPERVGPAAVATFIALLRTAISTSAHARAPGSP